MEKSFCIIFFSLRGEKKKKLTWRVAFGNVLTVLALMSLGHWRRRQQQRHQRHRIPHRPALTKL